LQDDERSHRNIFIKGDAPVSVRLKELYRLAAFVATFGVVGLGACLCLSQYRLYQRESTGVVVLDRFQIVLAAANAISAERGPANSAMGARKGEVEELRRSLNAARLRTDEALSAVASLSSAQGYPAPRPALQADIKTRLKAGREAVDAVIDQSADTRSPDQIRLAIESMFAAADAVTAVRDDLGRNIAATDPRIIPEIMLGSIGGSLREYAGRFGSYVVEMLSDPAADPSRFQQGAASAEGRIVQLRSLLTTYSGAYLNDPAIAVALEAVDRDYFGVALPYARMTAVAAKKPTHAEFTQGYVPGMRSIEKFRDLVLRLSRDDAVRRQKSARQSLIATTMLTACLGMLLTLMGAALHRMVFVPLMKASEEIIAVAQGGLKEPSPTRHKSKEIRLIFEALNVLRLHLADKQALAASQASMALELKRLSEIDPLTGILNRRAFDSMSQATLKAIAADGKFGAVILFDVDHFKSINDIHGHSAGDAVLCALAERIQSTLRPGDCLARHGGEEFVVLTSVVHRDDAKAIAERLRLILSHVTISNHPEISISASFGVSVQTDEHESLRDLIAEADRCLYAAKGLGRNRVYIDEGQGQSAQGGASENRVSILRAGIS
jgi:diguanylate cyclase (GGDEF)-like protein